jgi:hypothetical protein
MSLLCLFSEYISNLLIYFRLKIQIQFQNPCGCGGGVTHATIGIYINIQRMTAQ